MGGTSSLEAALAGEKNPVKRILKLLGPGLIYERTPAGKGVRVQPSAPFLITEPLPRPAL